MDHQSIPPRSRWLKRTTKGILALLVFLIAPRLWWGWEANRRLQAEIDRIVAAGEPIFPEDFNPKEKVPDEENAAKFYQRATDQLALTVDQEELIAALLDDLELLADPSDEVRQLFSDNGEAIRTYQIAGERAAAGWGVRFETPVYKNLVVEYSGQRNLIKLTLLAARLDHELEDGEGAVAKLSAMLRHAHYLRENPMLIAHLVSWVAGSLALKEVEVLILPPQIEVSTPLSRERVEHWKTSVRQIIQLLTFQDNLQGGFRHAMLVERMMQLDIIDSMRRGSTSIYELYAWRGGVQAKIPDFVWNTILWPSIELDGVRMMKEAQRRDKAVAGLDVSYWLDRADEAAEPELLEAIVCPLSKDSWSSLHRAGTLFLRVLSMHRLTATGLAIRLYRLEHGALPRTLQELVPNYLTELPIDLMSRDRRFLNYRPDDSPPVLYSVGENGVDDGGRFVIEDGQVLFDETFDIPFFIDGVRPMELGTDDEEESGSGEADADNGEVGD